MNCLNSTEILLMPSLKVSLKQCENKNVSAVEQYINYTTMSKKQHCVQDLPHVLNKHTNFEAKQKRVTLKSERLLKLYEQEKLSKDYNWPQFERNCIMASKKSKKNCNTKVFNTALHWLLYVLLFSTQVKKVQKRHTSDSKKWFLILLMKSHNIMFTNRKKNICYTHESLSQ